MLTSHRTLKTAALVALLAMATASCASGPGPGAGSGDRGAAVGTRGLPEVEVLDVSSGEPVQLAGLVPAAQATLVWFWAPH